VASGIRPYEFLVAGVFGVIGWNWEVPDASVNVSGGLDGANLREEERGVQNGAQVFGLVHSFRVIIVRAAIRNKTPMLLNHVRGHDA